MLLCLAIGLQGCDSSDRDSRRSRRKRKAEQPAQPAKRRKVKKPEGYLQTVIYSRTFAETRKCQTRLRTLSQELRIYASMNEKFPDSLAELRRPDLTKSPMRDAGSYKYVGGQTPRMDGNNVLVYLEEINHRGKYHVLRLGGTVEEVDPKNLPAELQATRDNMVE